LGASCSEEALPNSVRHFTIMTEGRPLVSPSLRFLGLQGHHPHKSNPRGRDDTFSDLSYHITYLQGTCANGLSNLSRGRGFDMTVPIIILCVAMSGYWVSSTGNNPLRCGFTQRWRTPPNNWIYNQTTGVGNSARSRWLAPSCRERSRPRVVRARAVGVPITMRDPSSPTSSGHYPRLRLGRLTSNQWQQRLLWRGQ